MRQKKGWLLALSGTVLLGTLAVAQSGSQQAAPPQMTPEQKAEMEAYMKAGAPGAPHQALAAMAGTYDMQIKAWHAPGQPPAEDRGTATRSMTLGGRISVEEVTAAMMGAPFSGHGMMGFDNVTGKYWSTWNDSMSTGLIVTSGTCDEQAKNCTFTGSWTDPVKKTPVKSRMTTRWPSAATEIFELYGPGPDGKEMKMMEITYTKKK
jgi:hypothetical protein